MPKRKNAEELTNLHMALLNAVAIVTSARFVGWLANGQMSANDLALAVGEGGFTELSASEVAAAAGYTRLSDYHYDCLLELDKRGLVKAGYTKKGGRRVYSLTPEGYKWSIGRFVPAPVAK